MKGKNKYNSVFEPLNLQLTDKLTPAELQRFGDRIRFITHFLIMNKILNRREDYDGWVSVHSRVWREALSKNYRSVLELAANLGIIEIDEFYLPRDEKGAGFTKSYRLCEPYASSAWQRIKVSNRGLLNYLQAKRDKRKRANWLPVHEYLWGWVKKVRIDDVPDLAVGSEDWIAYDLIRKADFRLPTRCDYGRWHTNLTNCPRGLRTYWRIGGEPLVETDIRNCQPLLLAWLVCSIAGNSSLTRVSNITIIYINQTLVSNIYIPYVVTFSEETAFKPLYNKDLAPKDALLLLELAENAQFYEHFLAEAGYFRVSAEAREKHKRNILTQFYDDWGTYRPREFVDVLRNQFPTAYQVCQTIKAGDYANLPRLMQRIESFVIIEHVCRRLMEQHPEVPVVTVHDAVFTTPRCRELVQHVIRETFRDVLGISPMFKGEDPCRFAHLRIDSSHGSSPVLFLSPKTAPCLTR